MMNFNTFFIYPLCLALFFSDYALSNTPASFCRNILSQLAPEQTLRGENEPSTAHVRNVEASLTDHPDEIGAGPLPISHFETAYVGTRGDVLVISEFPRFRVWHINAKKPGPAIEKEDGMPVSCGAVDEKAKAFRVVDFSGNVKSWSLKDGKVLSSFALPREAQTPEFSKDGKLLVVALPAGHDALTKSGLAERSRKPVEFDPDALAAASDIDSLLADFFLRVPEPTEIAVMDASNGKIVQRLRQHRGEPIKTIFSEDGELVLSYTKGGLIRVERVSDGALILNQMVKGEPRFVELSPDGKRLHVGSDESKVFDVYSNTEIAKSPGFSRGVFRPNNSNQVAVWSNRTIRVMEITSSQNKPKEVASVVGHSEQEPRRAAWSSDGSKLFIEYDDGIIRVWNPAQGILAEMTGQNTASYDIRFLNSGNRLIAIESLEAARVWNAGQVPNTAPATQKTADGTEIIQFEVDKGVPRTRSQRIDP